ncbi:hypothetical protein ONZ45_g9644 [Pleurotus djamor]|nr:hypothetical protein ONZ45_g9644 [Pleurotus djamor]
MGTSEQGLDILDEHQTTQIDPEVIEIPSFDDFRPSPVYESCTPIDVNQYIGEDPEPMKFFPFADDPEFNMNAYAEEYREVAWNVPAMDPDLQLIVLKTARLLRDQHQLSDEVIDSTDVLSLPPIPTLPSSTTRTLLDTATIQRDFPEGYQTLSQEPLPPVDTVGTLKERFPPNPATPRVSSSDLRLKGTESCGPECFLHEKVITDCKWSEEDLSFFETLFRLDPDAQPCDMSAIMRKPCNEIFYTRSRLVPKIIRRRVKRNPSSISSSYVLSIPAHAPMPAPAEAVVLVMTHEETVNAVASAPKSVNIHEIARTLIFNTGGAKYHICPSQVVDFSQVSQAVEVRASSYGSGLFLRESVRKGELIGEYVGETVGHSTTTARDWLALHKQRNYLYGVSAASSDSIDSAYAGGVVRFINHSESCNVMTETWMVNGDLNLGIYALVDLEAGDELFLNYGKNFFAKDSSQESAP